MKQNEDAETSPFLHGFPLENGCQVVYNQIQK